MDIVIPLRDKPSIYRDAELKYCLRSIDMYFPHRDVWCVGIPRPWLSVSWIEHPDNGNNRHESVRGKILKACANNYVSDPFVLWNDDFYLLKEITELHDYYDGTIEERLKTAGGTYKRMMQESLKHSDGRNYEVHAPLVIDKKLFKESIKEGSLYRNPYCSLSEREKVEMPDCKLYTKENHKGFRQFIKDRWMFSTSEFSFAFIHRHMERLYPDPSRWE